MGVVQSKLKAEESTGDMPQNVNFAIRGEVVQTFLSQNNIPFDVSLSDEILRPVSLAAQARKFTAFVECR